METNGNTKTNGVKNVSGETFKNVTVIQSRAVQYLLMKLRNKKTQGKVTCRKKSIWDYFNLLLSAF